jgi:hypothetical protein
MIPSFARSAQFSASDAAVAPVCGAHQVLVRRSVQYHLTDWFNE